MPGATLELVDEDVFHPARDVTDDGDVGAGRRAERAVLVAVERIFGVGLFDPAHRLAVRYVLPNAWHAHFVRNMFIRPELAELASWIDAAPDFERMAPVPFGLVCFRYRPAGATDEASDRLNERLMTEILDRTRTIAVTVTAATSGESCTSGMATSSLSSRCKATPRRRSATE